MAEGQYRIVKAQLPLIGGLAGHNFLVLLDPNGKVVGELHGLATDAEGHPKPIGNLPSDRLKSHSYNQTTYYDPEQAQTTLASGDQAKIMNLWTAATAAGNKMDGRDIHYPWMGLGQNSNSFASTLIAAMGLTEPPMSGGASVMPGARSMLLDPKDIRDIQRQFDIGASHSGDGLNAGWRPEDVGEPNALDSARWPFGPVGAPIGRTTAPPAGNPRSAVTPEQNLPRIAVDGAAGPTSLGTPNGPAPLVPSASSRARVPANSAPAADPTLPPLHFAPEQLPNFSPFAAPGQFRSDALGGPGVGSATSGANAPTLVVQPSLGVPRASPAATSPAVLGGIGPIGDGNGIGDWVGSVAPRAGSAIPLFEDRWNALGQGGLPAMPGRDALSLGGYGRPTAPQLMFDPDSLGAPPQPFSAPPGSAGVAPPEAAGRLTRMNTSNSGNALASGNAPASTNDGVFASDPSYSIPPPIWGFENRNGSRNEAEEWFARWIRPLLQQE